MNGDQYLLLLAFLMPLAAFLYASVGHGGASSFIVLLTLAGFAPPEVRSTALLLNILVSGIAWLAYRNVEGFPRDLFLSLVLFSIPASFLGGTLHVEPAIYQKILGILLLFPVARFFNLIPVRKETPVDRKIWMAPALGLTIGFVSGLIGIGGGIILSPVLLLLGWTRIKVTAAISALFIFFNSIAGLIASGTSLLQLDPGLRLLLPLTLAGGVAGSYLGARKFNVRALNYLLGTVLLIAAIKFLFA